MNHAIEITNLSKNYGSIKALDEIDLIVPKGSIFGYLGPNGAGKTTTMKILMGFLNYKSGSVKIFDKEVKNSYNALHYKIGYLPDTEMPKRVSINRFLSLSAKLNHISQREKRINEVLDNFGLSKLKNRKIGNLSKGQKQRVGLANAVLADPPLLILDEPNTGLDPIARLKVLTTLKDLAKEGKTILISSHIINEIDKVATNIAIIKDGKIIEQGKRAELQKKFLHYGTFLIGGKIDTNKILDLGYIKSCNLNHEERYVITTSGDVSEEKILSDLLQIKSKIKYFSTIETSLEEIFLGKINNYKQGMVI